MTRGGKKLMIKAKTRQEMASEYGIDRKTFYCWLKKANLPITSGLIYPSEIMLIYNTFGNPFSSNRNMDKKK